MTGVLDFIDRHTPNDPRLLRAFDFVLPALVLATLVVGIIQVGNVKTVSAENKANLAAQEDERSERIYATNALDEYFCGQIQAIKGAIEGILTATLKIPPRPDTTQAQAEVRELIATRLLRLESGGACKVRIPRPPLPEGHVGPRD